MEPFVSSPQPTTSHLPPGLIAVLGLLILTIAGSMSGRPAEAQERGAGTVAEMAVPRFHIPTESSQLPYPSLSGDARPREYLGVVGSRSAWLGFEDGSGEVWVHPLKVVRDLRISFKIPAYVDPIPGASLARRVTIRPGLATVEYDHAAFKVRQHVLAPRDAPGILILLEVDPVVELSIHVQFQPVMQYAWPGGFGGQYLYWDEVHRAFVLSESLQDRNALVGSPWATEASAHPAHRLADAPATLIIAADQERVRNEFIPIVVAGGTADRESVRGWYADLITGVRDQVEETLAWASSLSSDLASAAGGPVAGGGEVEESLEWAKVNLAEQRVCNPDLGCGLVAGWGPSGGSLRPGFGWFFGGDAAINSLAMDATGQWADVAEGLRFLARYQRDDGKIPHEISQAAGQIPWFEEFPYAYYHADTTPFWILALWYYWRASGDTGFVRELWPNLQAAYAWCLSVETDGDGIIENTAGGLGAIEVGGLGEGIHQDIYLAAVWIGALEGVEDMARALGDPALAGDAMDLRARALQSLNRRYWRPREGHHAFGILRNGETNDNLTAWPGTALAFGLLDEEEAEGTLRHLATDAISSQWGARLLSTESELYDPLHYNNGAVWPFMTGFVVWGQYRYRRSWAGYPLLSALLSLSRQWSLGRHPENMSGAFFSTMDATVPHQFFASSMVATSLLRGMVGWEPNAPAGKARLAPQPPPTWPDLDVGNLRVGRSAVTLRHRRGSGKAEIALDLEGPPITVEYVHSIPLGARNIEVGGNQRGKSGILHEGRHDTQYSEALELEEGEPAILRIHWQGGLEVVPDVPELVTGTRSGGIRVLDFYRDGDLWMLELEGDGGSDGVVVLRGEQVVTDGSGVAVEWGEDDTGRLLVTFPESGKRTRRTIRLRATGGSAPSGF